MVSIPLAQVTRITAVPEKKYESKVDIANHMESYIAFRKQEQ